MKSTFENYDLERYFYTVDEQGSTSLITSNAANICNEYYYDAFGNILESKEEVHNRITYTGQQYDHSTNQYYLRARFYNPVVGRFTQEDIYRNDGLNLYAYCEDNPVRYYDPSGYTKCPASKEVQLDTKIATKVGSGEYGEVGGHHIHAKAAFNGDINYDLNKGFSISQDFMKNNGWNHADMTTKQRQLFKELYESGRLNTLEEHTRIAKEALKAGGATEAEASELINQSLQNLVEQGVTQPTRIPWYSK